MVRCKKSIVHPTKLSFFIVHEDDGDNHKKKSELMTLRGYLGFRGLYGVHSSAPPPQLAQLRPASPFSTVSSTSLM